MSRFDIKSLKSLSASPSALTNEFLEPRGATPLLDAIGLAIHDLEKNSIQEDEKK